MQALSIEQSQGDLFISAGQLNQTLADLVAQTRLSLADINDTASAVRESFLRGGEDGWIDAWLGSAASVLRHTVGVLLRGTPFHLCALDAAPKVAAAS